MTQQYSTNNALFELFKKEDCTQIEFGHRIESDKNNRNPYYNTQ